MKDEKKKRKMALEKKKKKTTHTHTQSHQPSRDREIYSRDNLVTKNCIKDRDLENPINLESVMPRDVVQSLLTYFRRSGHQLGQYPPTVLLNPFRLILKNSLNLEVTLPLIG